MRALVSPLHFHRARRRLKTEPLPSVIPPGVLQLPRRSIYPQILSLSAPSRRLLHTSEPAHDVPTWPAPPIPQNPVGPSDNLSPTFGASGSANSQESFWRDWAHSASFQAALTTIVGLGMVFGAGVGYLEWYKSHVLHRMERAFKGGYDPALELSLVHASDADHIKRQEQPLIDSIVRGEQAGGYYLIVGPKGCGKGTMVLDAMRKVQAEGASVVEAHPDLEVFRMRLGKALDFDFYEDWQGSLFSRADPRQGGPQLDIERALNKLEKVALRYTKKHGRPLVLAFNNIHLFPNAPEGHAILHQLQQRAEAWAEAGIMTMTFSTDDFWCFDMLRKNASRMRIVSVYDLSASQAMTALRRMRRQNLARRNPGVPEAELPLEDDSTLWKIYQNIGGRTSYLARVARAEDMQAEVELMIENEKNWLQSKIGLIPDHDDDVMDEQKWASCSWLLLRHLAKRAALIEELTDTDAFDTDSELPEVTYAEARQVMTRTDFLEPLDHAHIISVDLHHHVRIDSVLLLRAVQRVISEEGFDEALDVTRERIDQIEGLHRQSELTVKEPFRVTVDRTGEKTILEVVGLGASFVPAEEEDEEADRLV